MDGPAAILDAGCENELESDDPYDECTSDYETQLAYVPCPETRQAFWQCPRDEYPGLFVCGDDGKAVQPDSCWSERLAVLDCSD